MKTFIVHCKIPAHCGWLDFDERYVIVMSKSEKNIPGIMGENYTIVSIEELVGNECVVGSFSSK